MSQDYFVPGTSSGSTPPTARYPSTMSSSRQSLSSPLSSSSTSLPHPAPPQANRRESARLSVQPSSLQQQLFGSASGSYASIPVGPQNILDRPLAKTKGVEVSMPAWAFMFAEIVSYSQSRSETLSDLERRLSTLGYEAGQRILALLLLRNSLSSATRDPKRQHRLIPILQFIHTEVYKYCFGKAADGLERSVDAEDEYMITLNNPPLTQHISVPKDMSNLSCEAFTAGIVEGVLDGLDTPARVTAHTVGTDAFPQRTVILIKLDPKVMDREEALGK
ncbi:hypothetical protein IAU60_002088 [Kwoniella sp. DSM 27419]